MTAGVRLWVRAELRGRWRSWVGVVLLIGLAGGATLAAVAGARRTSSSFDRFRGESVEAHAVVSTPPGGDPSLLDAVENLPGVVASGRAAILLTAPVGTDIRAGLDMAVDTPLDDRAFRTIERPRVVRGRLPAAARADEVAVNEALARKLQLKLGDRIVLQGPTPAELNACFESGACDNLRGGPAAPVVVVGVTRSLSDLDDRTFDSFGATASRAFHRRYGNRTASPGTGLGVRLAGGPAAVPAFKAAVTRISEDLEVSPAASGGVDDALGIQARALSVFAAAAAFAGLVAVGQAFARLAAAGAAGIATLGVLGAGRRQRWAAAVGPLVVAAPAGAALAVAGAWLASPLLPIGLGRRAEPHPGAAFDTRVLVLGGLALAAMVVARGAVSALRLAGASAGDVARGRGRGRPPVGLTRVLDVRRPPSLRVGARMALERGSGVTAMPVGSTLLGAVVGVAGLFAVLTFARSADRLQSDSALYGAAWSAQISVADKPGAAASAGAAAERAGRVDALGLVGQGRVTAAGRPDVLAIAVEPQRGTIGATVLAGRPPMAPDEALVGGDLLKALGRHVGDTIDFEGDAGKGTYRIVGRGSVPIIDSDSRTDGLVFTMDGLERLVSSVAGEDGLALLVRWAPGTDLVAARKTIDEAGFGYDPPFVPTEVDNLGELGAIPEALAGFLAALGLGATAHALAVTVRRRRRDLAVLRALGFTPGDTRWTVAWQAMATVAVGLGAGIPLGLVAGRAAWSSVAGGLEVVDRPSVPVLALVLAVPAGLALVNMLALLPGRAAARLRPAVVLRGE
ncbi:MAG TPA: FtsX-like permease family protein [Acidimicrobiales bacterium]|nr:FtsX-like permease family protein [Acidimicrobiales bacterium]